MAKSFRLSIITPSKVFYEGDVELLVVPTLEGEEGFMANHSWATKLLNVGEMAVQEAGKSDFRIASIAGGFIDVKDSVILYADHAEWSEEIDKQRAQKEKEFAEEWLSKNKDEKDEYSVRRAEVALKKAISRLNVANGGRRGI